MTYLRIPLRSLFAPTHGLLLRRSALLRGLLGTLLGALLLSPTGCKKKKSGADAGGSDDKMAQVEMKVVRVPRSSLSLKVPKSWRVEKTDPGPPPSKPKFDKDDPKIVLSGRSHLTIKAPASAKGAFAVPRVQVFSDPWLPAGTTATEYMEAERKVNAKVVEDIRHVEAERSRRQGRPTYMVRDEWHFASKNKASEGRQARVSQETLLLIDKRGDDAFDGYSVVVTLLAKDRNEHAAMIRRVLDSVTFAQ